MRVGIVGLPQSGKTTLFNALSGAHGEVGGYHAGGQLSLAVVSVPDERLDALAEMLEPKEALAASSPTLQAGSGAVRPSPRCATATPSPWSCAASRRRP